MVFGADDLAMVASGFALTKAIGEAVVAVGRAIVPGVSKRRREIACQRRNRYVSLLLSPPTTLPDKPPAKTTDDEAASPLTQTWDVNVDGLSDQQILAFRAHGKRESCDRAAVAWVKSIKVMSERDRAFCETTGTREGTFTSVVEKWEEPDDLDVTYLAFQVQDKLMQAGTQYPQLNSEEIKLFAQTEFGNKAKGWSLLSREAMAEEKCDVSNAEPAEWEKVRESCKALLALVESGNSTYCLLQTDSGLVRIDGSPQPVRLHNFDLPNVKALVTNIHQNSKAVRAILAVADKLQCEEWNLITCIRMAIFLFNHCTLRSTRRLDTDDDDYVKLVELALKALENDIILCSRLRSELLKDVDTGTYFCDLTAKEMGEVRGLNNAPTLLKRVEHSSEIQCHSLKEATRFDGNWKPYSLSHHVVEGIKALRDAHIAATRKRFPDNRDTRHMVALAVLIFRHKVDPRGVVHSDVIAPKSEKKTALTIGERLSAIYVPFSRRLCIYNHDLRDYEMDKFKQQPFDDSDSCFLEPMSILWKVFSDKFPPKKVEELDDDLEEDYTTIFRLNNKTFNLIEECSATIKMSALQEKCADLKGSDSFRAHVYRELLCRIVKAGAQQTAGPTGRDTVFKAVSEGYKYGTTSLLVKVDSRTDLSGIMAMVTEVEGGDETFKPPPNQAEQYPPDSSVHVLVTEDIYLVVYGSPSMYHAVIRHGSGHKSRTVLRLSNVVI